MLLDAEKSFGSPLALMHRNVGDGLLMTAILKFEVAPIRQ